MMDALARSSLTQKKAILQSVGRLIRGLSALFWGLPIVLLSEAHPDLYARAREWGILLPLLTNALLLFGLKQVGTFQQQERVWTRSIDRAFLIGLLNLGLTPFLFFWHGFPDIPFFNLSVGLLFLCGLVYLFHLNFVLRRLAFMIPDETLRHDTELFSGLNRRMLSMMILAVGLYHLVWTMPSLPFPVLLLLKVIESNRPWLIVFMVVMPVAMTMTMVWKIKEILLDQVDEWSREVYSNDPSDAAA
ncbi:hypothetical protein OAE97_00815 [Verrucomicrobia bacterium]|nr:hypothetical protein [Verrucomicrobiota bacterium]MDB4664869.1 hypothetical protein [Verrucomicrobiota bacterium]MDG1889723.1 hypothetical protein [Verrucomicrobiota bacterium]